MHGFNLAAEAVQVQLARLSAASRASSEGPAREAVVAAHLPAGEADCVEAQAQEEAEPLQQAGEREQGPSLAAPLRAQAQHAQQGRGSPAAGRAPSPSLPSLPSLGAAAAASALMVAGGPSSRDPATLATALTAGMRAAELSRAGSGASGLPSPAQLTASRAATPQPQPGSAAGKQSPSRPPLPRSQRPSGGSRPGSETGAAAASAGVAQPAAAYTDRHEGRDGDSGRGDDGDHVTLELGEVHLSTTSEGEGWGGGLDSEGTPSRPLVRPGSHGSAP